MQKIRSKNTLPEVKLRKALWKAGLRYRVTAKGIAGSPDIAVPSRKLAIFVDGEFWHGKKLTASRLSEMKPYWQAKIAGNVQRDIETNRLLIREGWMVVRVTDLCVRRHLDDVVGHIMTICKRQATSVLPDGMELISNLGGRIDL